MKKIILFSLIGLNLLLSYTMTQARSLQNTIVLGMQGQLAQTWFHDLNRMLQEQDCGFITREPNTALHDIDYGLACGFSLEYGLTDTILIGASYEALFPSTELRIGSWLLSDRIYGIYLGAAQYGVTAKYTWQEGESFIFNAGVELFYLQLVNAYEIYKRRLFLSTMQTLARLDYKGSTLGGKLFGGVDLFLFNFLSLNGEIGFRYARIGQVTGIWHDGPEVVLKNPDGTNFSLDYSGFFISSGIKFWL